MTDAAPPRRHSVRSNVIAIFTGQVLTLLLTTATIPIIARYLGTEGVGAMSIGGTFAALGATVAGLGMNHLVTREVARDREGAHRIVSTAFWMSIALGLIAAVVASVAGLLAGYSGETEVVIILSCAVIPFTLVATLIVSTIQGMEVMRHLAAFDVGIKALSLVVLAAAALMGLSLIAIVTLALIQSAIVLLIQVVYARHWLHIRLMGRPSMEQMRNLAFGARPFFIMAVVFMVYGQLDVVALSKLADERAVGLYSAPARIFGTMLIVPITIMTVTFPMMASSTDQQQLRRVATVALQVSLAITIGLIILATGVRDDTLARFLGNDFADSGPVLALLALALVPMSTSIVASRVLFATNRQTKMTIAGLVGLAFKVVFMFTMVPLFRDRFDNAALGAALAQVGSESVMAIIAVRYLPEGWFTRQQKLYFVRLAASACAAGLVLALTWNGLALVGAVAAGIVYVLVAALLRVFAPRDIRRALEMALSRRTHQENQDAATAAFAPDPAAS
jgi:O-antigen/teichoic acid export membrane protein